MQGMKFLCLLLLLSILVLLGGCCDKDITEPKRPVVEGWKAFPVGSIMIKGTFILQKGKSTGNGKVGIKLVELYPAKCAIARITQLPYVKMQLYKISDKSILCERMFGLSANVLNFPDVCSDELEWDVIWINSINFKEKWVAFELR